MYLPSSTEGQLYRALVVWAEHWIQEGRYTSLQEAIAEFIPRLVEVSSPTSPLTGSCAGSSSSTWACGSS